MIDKPGGPTHRQRLEACLAGRPLDRPPVALWRHFPVDDQDPSTLAAAALDFQRTYDFDLVKITPASSFCLKDWGAQDVWRGNTEGTRDYVGAVIQSPEDWRHLRVLNPEEGFLAAQIACLRTLIAGLDPQTPVLQTIFSPLAQAKNLAGRDLLPVHLRLYPEVVRAGLEVIAESTRRFIRAARQTGIAGIFYAVQHAQYGLLSEAEFEIFGRAFDLPVLEKAQGLWLNMLHLHGENVMFNQVADYPVAVINWHDRDTYPSLAEAQDRFPGVVCGGLQRQHTMVLGTPAQVASQVRQSFQETAGKRFILGTGCVLPIIAPRANILAARRSVDQLN